MGGGNIVNLTDITSSFKIVDKLSCYGAIGSKIFLWNEPEVESVIIQKSDNAKAVELVGRTKGNILFTDANDVVLSKKDYAEGIGIRIKLRFPKGSEKAYINSKPRTIKIYG